MPKRLKYQLTTDELTDVRKAIASDKRAEVRHRAMAIQLLHQGMKPQEVADMLAVSLGSIYKWHARWREGGLNALADQPRSGAPPKADEAYWQRVGEIVEQDPAALGYDFTIWTAERLSAHMARETGIELSVSRFRIVMSRRGYVYRRPKHDLKSLQDPEARSAAEMWLNELKKGPLKGSSISSSWTKQP
jgi:putative transposase